ncbi:hypothetical protein [Flavivirga eckloniae]|uniref:Uncharacterized protein n=1 Tax=Flavivirga eckloniae TaxID=1803846 RepID=A0A2K9PUA3_9FLAO|nr:hypothetical protein [Flavivirga eckloniae]AUP80646.1 hypothetical protein C1H87_18780 [Flavivirga eckloniae]
MINGFILLILSIYIWFGTLKQPAEQSSSGFIFIWKKIFGVKGYVITAKIIAVLVLLAALSEFYKHFGLN